MVSPRVTARDRRRHHWRSSNRHALGQLSRGDRDRRHALFWFRSLRPAAVNCPHRAPCEECREIERSTARQFAWICAVLAPLAALVALVTASEREPRGNRWTGVAIGLVLVWVVNWCEYKKRPGTA